MSARFTDGIGYAGRPDLTFHFWLAFNSNGDIRLSRGEPSTDRDERKMKVELVVPKVLWKTPQLAGTITVAAPSDAVADMRIDTEAAAEAIRGALGVDIDLVVRHAETE